MEFEPGGPDLATSVDVVADVAAPAPTSDREGADPAAELGVDESLLDAIENDLADVERALALLDEGTYGRCEVCGRSLEDAVLAQAPATRFCSDHLPLSLP